MMDLTQSQWVRHSVMHPAEGFEDMRWKKAGSLKISFLIIFLLFIAQILHDRLFGFQFFSVNDKLFSIIPYLVRSIVLFGGWVIGSSAVGTFLDGEGSMRNICIYSAYALIPYILQLYVNVILSHILIRDEYIFIQLIAVIGTGWTALLLFSATRTVHQYSPLKTVFAMILTIAAMLIMLILLVLLLSLISQVIRFVYSVYTEISYRIRV